MTRRLMLILAITLLGAGWLVQPALAAEASGPSTPAAPSACSGVSLLLSAPATLSRATLSPATLPAVVTPLMICGCGLPVCMNKLAGESCGTGMKCIANGHCDLSPPTYFCDCG